LFTENKAGSACFAFMDATALYNLFFVMAWESYQSDTFQRQVLVLQRSQLRTRTEESMPKQKIPHIPMLRKWNSQ